MYTVYHKLHVYRISIVRRIVNSMHQNVGAKLFSCSWNIRISMKFEFIKFISNNEEFVQPIIFNFVDMKKTFDGKIELSKILWAHKIP